MAHTKVTDADLRAFLDAGHSQAAAARHFGVSEPAIHQRLKRLRRLTSRVVAFEQAGQVVEEKLTATARLERVQEVIDDELAWAVTQARQDGADRAALVEPSSN
jgi:predicted RNA polymerase sigma factor